MVMRRSTLPVLLALAMVLSAGPGAAQTIEQRFERWFGPPVGQAGQGTRPARSSEPARPRTTAPAATSVPTPSERPAEDSPPPPTESIDDVPTEPAAGTEAPGETTEAGPASDADTADDGPPDGDGAADEAADPGTASETDADPTFGTVPTPEPRPSDEPDGPATDEPFDPSGASDAVSQAAAPLDAPAEPGASEPEPSPAYVPPENARTSPEESAPDTPDFEVTPQESVDAARAIEDARLCETELKARGATFTVAPSLSDGQCGVLRPVSLTRTSSGVAIGPGTQMLCRTALAFDIWVGESVGPAARAELGTGAPSAIRQVSTYVCRDRASETGLSEHGRGSAIDVGAFEFEGREPVRVEEQAPGSPEDRFLASVRRAACGPFQTVIGPGTDADHSDHFHLDIAARSNGSTYCR